MTWTIEGTSQFQIRSETGQTHTICTENHGILRGDGTWLLRIQHPAVGPVIEVEGDGAATIATIRETVAAALNLPTLNGFSEKGNWL